jgi:parallel beta-helix repeat protein
MIRYTVGMMRNFVAWLVVLVAAGWAAADVVRVVVDPGLGARDDGALVVATLGEAAAWAKGHRGQGESIEIVLVPGDHVIRESVRFGADLPPLKITGGGPGVRLVGGLVIEDPHWQSIGADDGTAAAGVVARVPALARGQVRMLELGALGDWAGGLSGPAHRGMGVTPTAIRSEVFVAGEALTPARWPNTGFARVAGVTDVGSIPRKAAADIPEAERVIEPDRGGTFLVADNDRLARWAAATGVWVNGYWWWDWADEQLPVERIDASAGTVTLGLPHRYGLRASAKFFVTNLPEELDAPGEYWIDVEAGAIYAWVPAGLEDGEVAVSLLAGPMIVLDDADAVTIEGLEFAFSRAGAIEATGVTGLTIRRCSFTNLGTRAIGLTGASSTIAACLFDGVGGTGVSLGGGDRMTLSPSGNSIEDCIFQDCSRVLRTYNPAIRLAGVGQRVVHNEISDLPHMAIAFAGNEHLIEGNRIHHVVQETGDAGAIYCGRDWTLFGTVITGNYFHDIDGSDGRYQNAVYLDDMASGITVENNLFVRCNWGLLVGGGRDNTIRDNAFVSCGRAIHFDARGVGWMAKNIADPSTSTLHRNLAAVPIDQEPWKSRYPSLSSYLSDRFGRPVGSVVERFVLVDTPLGNIDDREAVKVGAMVTIEPGGDEIGGPPEAAAYTDGLLARASDPEAVFVPLKIEFDFPAIHYGATGPRVAAVGALAADGP